MTTERLVKVSGARGESFADVARRTGVYGTLPTDTDEQAYEKFGIGVALETAIGDAVDEAAASAAFAEGFSGPVYASQAAGEAATVEGQTFRVTNGDGPPETTTAYRRTAGGSVALSPLATTASLAQPTGGNLVGYQNRLAGSVARTSKSKEDDFASLLDFVNPAYHTDILNGAYAGDLSAAFDSALDSGEVIRVPGGKGVSKYVIDGTIRIREDFQRLVGFGARLELVGQDINANAIEILSMRRDNANNALTRVKQGLQGFRITGPLTAKYKNLIWLEQGTFSPIIADIYSESGTGKGFFGEIGESFFKSDGGDDGAGNAVSYPNDLIMRDVLISGISFDPGSGAAPPPVGFNIENLIEGRFYNCVSFYYADCWRFGGATAARRRNNSNLELFGCQGEPGHPNREFDNMSAARFYALDASDFFGCRFDPGQNKTATKAATTTNHVGLRFSGDGATNGVSIIGGQVALFGSSGYGISVEDTHDVRDLRIDPDVDFRDLAEGHMVRVTGSKTPRIHIDPDRQKVYRTVPRRAAFRSRGYTFTATGSMATGTEQTQTQADLYGPTDVPILASINHSQTFMSLFAHRTSASGSVITRVLNQSGANRSIATDTNLALRPFHPTELFRKRTKSIAVGTVAAGGHTPFTISMPGVKVGDPLAVAFPYPAVGGTGGVRYYAYCETDGEAIVIFYNPLAADVNLPTATNVTIWQVKEEFDLYGETAYDVSTMAGGLWANVTLAIPGVALGDHVFVWYRGGARGKVFMSGIAQAADLASALMKNIQGVSPATAAPNGKICYGVYKRHTAM